MKERRMWIALVAVGIIAFGSGVVSAQMAGSIYLIPVKGPLTGKFGMRKHPITKKEWLHAGIDIACRRGTPVKAIGSGYVLAVGSNRLDGRFVIIRHLKDEYTSHYHHLEKTRTLAGRRVSAGQVIGSCGSSGRATGPHLHLEMRKAVDPKDLLGI